MGYYGCYWYCVLFCWFILFVLVMVGFYWWEFWCYYFYVDSRRGKWFIDGFFLFCIFFVVGFIIFFCLVFFYSLLICCLVCFGVGSVMFVYYELFGDFVFDDYCWFWNECYIF